MQKPFEKRTKAKQSYWFLTNETAYLNGQQPHGRRDCRRGRRCGREPEVSAITLQEVKKGRIHLNASFLQLKNIQKNEGKRVRFPSFVYDGERITSLRRSVCPSSP